MWWLIRLELSWQWHVGTGASDSRQRGGTPVKGTSGPRMGFDLLAPHYFWMEWVLAGRKLQRCRTAFLARTRNAKSALLLGEGNGRFLSELLEVNTDASVVCVDSSRRMIEEARRRCAGLQRVEFHQGDLLELAQSGLARGRFDLVVTNFLLDCFRADQLERIVPAIARQTATAATWLVADFRVPPCGIARWRAKLILRLAYTFFRITTGIAADQIAPADHLLTNQGFRLEERHIYDFQLLHSDFWRKEPQIGSANGAVK